MCTFWYVLQSSRLERDISSSVAALVQCPFSIFPKRSLLSILQFIPTLFSVYPHSSSSDSSSSHWFNASTLSIYANYFHYPQYSMFTSSNYCNHSNDSNSPSSSNSLHYSNPITSMLGCHFQEHISEIQSRWPNAEAPKTFHRTNSYNGTRGKALCWPEWYRKGPK